MQKKKNLKRISKKLKSLWNKFYFSKNNKMAMDLIENKRNDYISFKGRSFRVGEKGSTVSFTGLTRRLHDVFWPQTDDNPEGNEDSKSRKPLFNKEHYVPSIGMKRTCKTWGSIHGKKVHKQISKIIGKITSGKSIKLNSNLDPCTLRILNLFCIKSWIPFVTEFQIFDESSSVATAIDFCVFDTEKSKIILIELKTGYETQEYGELPEDEYMKHINIKNCPLNRHMLQLLWMQLVLEKRYGLKVDESMILRTCPKQRLTHLINKPNWSNSEHIRQKLFVNI